MSLFRSDGCVSESGLLSQSDGYASEYGSRTLRSDGCASESGPLSRSDGCTSESGPRAIQSDGLLSENGLNLVNWRSDGYLPGRGPFTVTLGSDGQPPGRGPTRSDRLKAGRGPVQSISSRCQFTHFARRGDQSTTRLERTFAGIRRSDCARHSGVVRSHGPEPITKTSQRVDTPQYKIQAAISERAPQELESGQSIDGRADQRMATEQGALQPTNEQAPAVQGPHRAIRRRIQRQEQQEQRQALANE